MEIKYVIHRVSEHPVVVQADHEGEQRNVRIDALEVELTPERARHGTVVLRFVGGEIPEAKDKFVEGETITINFGE